MVSADPHQAVLKLHPRLSSRKSWRTTAAGEQTSDDTIGIVNDYANRIEIGRCARQQSRILKPSLIYKAARNRQAARRADRVGIPAIRKYRLIQAGPTREATLI